MFKRIAAIVFIYGCTAVAWLILGGVTHGRTSSTDASLRGSVAGLWGPEHRQKAPLVYREVSGKRRDAKGQVYTVKSEGPVTLAGSDIEVDINLDARRKGLLWYNTYGVRFDGIYTIRNVTAAGARHKFVFSYPARLAEYDDMRVAVDGRPVSFEPGRDSLSVPFTLAVGRTARVAVGYRSRGMDAWRYDFGDGITQVKDFRLTMSTDFSRIDYPAESRSPDGREELGKGWRLSWRCKNLLRENRSASSCPRG